MLKALMLIACGVLAATPAEAQRKPDAPPANQVYETAPDVGLFAEAYQRAGEPTLLVLTGIDSRPAAIRYGSNTDDLQPQGRTATGIPDTAEYYVGSHLALFDPTGDSAKLGGDIEEVLLQNLDVDLVDLDALAERDRREVRLLQQRDEDGAIALLAEKLNAEVVLLVRMLNTPAVEQRGALYRVFVDVVDVPRGRKIGGFTFDWTQGADGVMVKRYGQQIARKFIEQFAAWYARGDDAAAARRYSVRLVGVGDVAEVVEAKRAFADLPGVSRIKERGFTTDGQASVATLDLRYTGSPLELMVGLQETARETLGLEIDATDGASGTITLIAPTDKQRDPADRWLALVDKDDPDHEAVVAELMHEYEGEGRPKIGIIVNRAASDDDASDSGDALGAEVDNRGGVFVNISVDPGDGPSTAPIDAGPLLDTRRMEDAMYKQMLELGLTMVDPDYARQRLAGQADKAKQVYGEDELVFRLGQAAGLDIVIQGVGRERPGGAAYTFRAVRINDGVTLAAEGVSHNYWLRRQEQATVNLMAAYATGHLLDQMMIAWSPASAIEVTVTDAADQREVFAIMDALKNNVDAIESVRFERYDAGEAGGVGVFTLSYRGEHDALLGSIDEQGQKLPFELVPTGTTRDTIALRVEDSL